MSKFRIHEVLGINQDETFMAQGDKNTYFINSAGRIRGKDTEHHSTSVDWLCDIINNPSLIIRKPRITEEEREILKAAVVLFDAVWVTRDRYGNVWIWKDKPCKTPINSETVWLSAGGHDYSSKMQGKFNFIKFSDPEPTKIDDLLGE